MPRSYGNLILAGSVELSPKSCLLHLKRKSLLRLFCVAVGMLKQATMAAKACFGFGFLHRVECYSAGEQFPPLNKYAFAGLSADQIIMVHRPSSE